MLLREIGDKKVYSVAHSMGNQVLSAPCRQGGDEQRTDLNINER